MKIGFLHASSSNGSYEAVSDGVEAGSEGYERFARWCLCIGTFLLPIFLLPWSSNVLELNKQLLLMVFVGLALIAWLLSVVSSGVLSWRSNTLDKGILVFAGSVVLATVFSLTRFKSVFGLPDLLGSSLVSILALTLFYFLAVNVFNDKGKMLVNILGISLVVALLYGLLQMLGVYFLGFSFSKVNGFNTVGSVYSLGMVAALALPLFSKLKIGGKTWVSRLYIEKVGVIAVLAILVILNWWILWIVAISGMVALVIFGSINREKFRILKFVMPMMIIVLGVFLMIVNFNLTSVRKKLPTEIAPSFSLSFDVSREVLKRNLLFGYGPENFSVAFDQYGASKLANTTFSAYRLFNSTSEFFNMVISGGLVLILAFLFLMCVLVWTIFVKLKISQISSRVEGTLASLMATLVALFLYPFNMTLMFIFFLLLALAVLMLWGGEKKILQIEERVSLSLASSLGFIAGMVVILGGFYLGGSIYASDVEYQKALKAKSNQEAAEFLSQAINWNSRDDRYYRTMSQIILALLKEEINKKSDPKDSGRLTRTQNYLSTSISVAKQATEVAPKESLNWLNLANIYQNLLGLVDGVDNLAEDSYLKAANLRSGDPNIYNQIGSIYLTKTDLIGQLINSNPANSSALKEQAGEAISKAEISFKKATELSNNFGLAIYNLAIVYDREGKLNEAIKQLEKIIPFNADQPGLSFELGLLYYRNSQKDKALDQLKRAVLLAPDYSNARWYLALIYEERGDIPSAIEQMEKILGIDANKDNQMVLTKLDELKKGKKTIPSQKVLDHKPL